MTATMKELKAAFTEWDRRWRQEPKRFQSESDHLKKSTAKTYGDKCGPYFEKIVREVQRGAC